MRADRPYVPAEQLEECDRGARRVAEQNRPTVQLSDRPSREQRHALHRPVARDPDLGEEPEQIGVARVLDRADRSEEHTSELQSQSNLVCRLLLEKKKKNKKKVSTKTTRHKLI